MKKLLALMLTLSLLLLLGGCCMNNRQLYEQAQLCLGENEYQAAAALFRQLGEYDDAAEYAMYAEAIDALENGELELAHSAFTELSGFKSADRYLRYTEAELLALNGQTQDALAMLESLGTFYHSADEAEQLRAQSRKEQQAADYAAAQKLYAEGRFAEAWDAFEALGCVQDAPVRVQMCRSALYRAAEEGYARVTLESSAELMAQYRRLQGYLNADARLQALTDTFGVRLALMEPSEELPCVAFGRSADGSTVLWRVLAAEDGLATLVCCSTLTAQPAATATDLNMDLSVPDGRYSVSLSQPDNWTPTLDAAGLHSALEADRALQAVLTGPGSLADAWLSALKADGEAQLLGCLTGAGGLRPIITVTMADWALTEGAGTMEDPYR